MSFIYFKVRKVAATGLRIFLPHIPGVGSIRQRYPIMPAHFEGSTTEKNLAALQVSHGSKYGCVIEKLFCLSSQPNHMFGVLKRAVSMRRLF